MAIDWQTALRLICAANILMLAVVLLSQSRSRKAWVLVAFFLSVVAYVLRTFVRDDAQYGVLTFVVFALVFAVAPLLLLLSRAIFDDDFKILWSDYAQIIFVELANFIYYFHFVSTAYRIKFSESTEILLLINSIPYVIQLTYSTLAILVALKGRQDDLINQRISFRWHFVSFTGLVVIGISLIELIWIGEPDSIPVHSAFLFVIIAMSFYVGTGMFRLENNFFIQAEKKDGAVKFSDELISKFSHMLETEKIYLRSDLTVEKVAEQLGEPVYKVRSLINGELAFRNFNDFLNHYRVAEAKQRLLLPENKDKAIIDLAFELGYNSLAPFNKAFKRLTQKSPTEFRAR